MLTRIIEKTITEHFASGRKEALIIDGARQVEKPTSFA